MATPKATPKLAGAASSLVPVGELVAWVVHQSRRWHEAEEKQVHLRARDEARRWQLAAAEEQQWLATAAAKLVLEPPEPLPVPKEVASVAPKGAEEGVTSPVKGPPRALQVLALAKAKAKADATAKAKTNAIAKAATTQEAGPAVVGPMAGPMAVVGRLSVAAQESRARVAALEAKTWARTQAKAEERACLHDG